MPIYITPQKVKMRSLEGDHSNQFYGLDVVAAETTAEQVAAINRVADEAEDRVNDAVTVATTTINSTINTATTNLNTAATNANAAANNLNSQVQAIATAIVEAEGNGTDPTLTLPNVAADAKATGDTIGGLKSALYIKKADTSLWTVGSIGTNDGVNASQSKRLRTKTYVPDNVKGISFDNEYSGVVYAYNPADNDSYVGAWTGSGFSSSVAASWLSGEVVFATLSSNNYKYRVVIKNSGGTAMSASEAVNAPFIYVADDTLAVAGVPADAKKVGDELSTLDIKIDTEIGVVDEKIDDLTGGAYQAIPVNNELNLDNYRTPGNYYAPTSDVANSVQNKPFSAPFKLHVVYSLPGSTTRVTQIVEPCYGHTTNRIAFYRIVVVATGPATNWISVATTDTATTSNDGLMASTDKVALNKVINDLETITGGLYQAIPVDTNLNSFVMPGNYYTSTSEIATSILNKPLSVPFKLHNEYAFPGSTRRITQTVEPCYGQTVNRVQYIRIVDTQGEPTRWFCVATDDVATPLANGLMASADKIKLDSAEYPGNFENIEFPSVISSVADLLRIEKTICTMHDNFHRADNSSDIGSNASGSFNMDYSSVGSTSLNVGISNNTAVSSGGNTGDVAIRYKDTRGGVPYKACMSFVGQGTLAISLTEDGANYIKLIATPNAVSVAAVGSAVCTAANITHNANCSDLSVYVYVDKIRVYVADNFVLETAATVTTSKCGLLFAYGESNVYTTFVLFVPAQNIPIGLDKAVEKDIQLSNNLPKTFINSLQQADDDGVTVNSEITNHSLRSIRFKQTYAASTEEKFRAEITLPFMRPRNYPLQSKIFSYDLYFPDDYQTNDKSDVIWQMHHTDDADYYDGMIPNIGLATRNGNIYLDIATSAFKVRRYEDYSSLLTLYNPLLLGTIPTGEWHHYDIYIREGYMASHNPVVAVYRDGENIALFRGPNAYNTKEGSFLKMGMYHSDWKHSGSGTSTDKRIIYYDNIKLWQ